MSPTPLEAILNVAYASRGENVIQHIRVELPVQSELGLGNIHAEERVFRVVPNVVYRGDPNSHSLHRQNGPFSSVAYSSLIRSPQLSQISGSKSAGSPSRRD
jgi:hypothetical protein